MVEPSVESLRDRADQLDAQKRTIEARLQEIILQLDTIPGKPGLRDPLVDDEGFPRADVDVYLTRQLRNEHISAPLHTRTLLMPIWCTFGAPPTSSACCMFRSAATGLHNDLRGTMDELHSVLNAIHTAIRNSTPTASPPRFLQSPRSPTSASRTEQPFAVVQKVEPNSPANDAGLKVGDKVVRFGEAQGPAGLTVLQSRLTAYQGKEQPVTVQRQAEIVHLKLTPKSWTGQGILGTTLIPL